MSNIAAAHSASPSAASQKRKAETIDANIDRRNHSQSNGVNEDGSEQAVKRHRSDASPMASPVPAHLLQLLDSVSHRLHLPPPPARLALQLLHQLVLTASECTDELHSDRENNAVSWVACCVYLAIVIARAEAESQPVAQSPTRSQSLPSLSSPPQTFPTLSFVLTSCQLTVDEFVRQLNHCAHHCFAALAQCGIDTTPLEARVNKCQQSLLYAIALFAKYQSLYHTIIETSYHSQLPTTELQHELFGAGWLLYTACKSEFRDVSQDSYSLYIALLAVLRIVLVNVLVIVNDSKSLTAEAALSKSLDSVVASLQSSSVSPEEARASINKLHIEWLHKFLSELSQSHSLKLPSQSPSQPLSHSSPLLIFHPSVFDGNVSELGHLLDSEFSADDDSFGFDERIFLLAKYKPSETASVSNGNSGDSNEPATRTTSTRRLFADSLKSQSLSQPQAQASSPASLSHSPSPLLPKSQSSSSGKLSALAFSPALKISTTVTATASHTQSFRLAPISKLMESVSWLTMTFAAIDSAPSAELAQMLAHYTPNITPKIQSVIQSLSSTLVFPDMNLDEARVKRELARKVYWTVIANIVRQESSTQSPSSLQEQMEPTAPPVWLTRRSMHATLLALSFELVSFAYRSRSESAILTLTKPLFNLSWFDYFRCLDSLLSNLPSMPQLLRNRLIAMDSTIVEEKAWSKGEKPVAMIRDSRVSAAITALFVPSSLLSQSSPTEIIPDYNLFVLLMRKLLAILSDRLAYLCSDAALGLTEQLEHAAWSLLCHCIFAQPSLLVNHHSDTLLLCAIYAIAVKVGELPLQFTRIIDSYLSRYNGNAESVIRRVKLSTGASVSIIGFYNDDFIRGVKHYAINVCKPWIQQHGAQPLSECQSLLPAPRRLHTPSHMVMSHPNIFISPLRGSAASRAHNVMQTPARSSLSNGTGGMSTIIGASPSKDWKRMNSVIHNGGRTAPMTPASKFSMSVASTPRTAAAAANVADHGEGVAVLLLADSLTQAQAADAQR